MDPYILANVARRCAWLVLFFNITISYTAMAITCTKPTDWAPGFCDLPIATSSRCAIGANNWAARGACVPGTDGCANIGGCFGFTPVGHWWPITEGGTDKRCQCGCFAEETIFKSNDGDITGSEIISRVFDPSLSLNSLDDFNAATYSERGINGVIFGPEDGYAYHILTEGGHGVILSAEHPVLIVSEFGVFVMMKAASKVNFGDYVLTDNGDAVPVMAIKKEFYSNQMLNFNVASNDPQNHLISANSLVLGDNAWQQRLASIDAKILLRSDLVKELQEKEVP